MVEHWTFNPGVPGSNPGGLIAKGMVGKTIPFLLFSGIEGNYKKGQKQLILLSLGYGETQGATHKSKTIDKLASEFEQCQKIYSRLFQSKDRRI